MHWAKKEVPSIELCKRLKEYMPTSNEIDARVKLVIFLREAGYITFNQGDESNAQSRQQT